MNDRRVRAAIGAGMFATTAVAFLRAPLLPEMGGDLGLTAFGLGALGSVFALGRLAADFPAGRLTERARPGTMMAVAAAAVGFGRATMGLAPTATLAYLAAFVLGVGSSWTMTTSMSVFAGAPRPQDRPGSGRHRSRTEHRKPAVQSSVGGNYDLPTGSANDCGPGRLG